ncbi:hypothetical protein PG985_001365 [Apiospora marii]|uniref:C2H2-type domain-containing protein n=1 Tax=Apiospora marii TaxID=335849 RepID=A0ABR1RHP4_9PEZI
MADQDQPMQEQDRPFVCEICQDAWKRKDELVVHKWRKHGINTPWVCHHEGCKRKGQGLATESLLERHLKGHDSTLKQNANIHSDRIIEDFAALHRQMTDMKHDDNREEFENLRPEYMAKVAELSGMVMNLTK